MCGVTNKLKIYICVYHCFSQSVGVNSCWGMGPAVAALKLPREVPPVVPQQLTVHDQPSGSNGQKRCSCCRTGCMACHVCQACFSLSLCRPCCLSCTSTSSCMLNTRRYLVMSHHIVRPAPECWSDSCNSLCWQGHISVECS